MGSRFQSHQLGNGLYVSGPEQPKEKSPAMGSSTMPYIGGDIRKSGELGKMFDIHMENSKTKKSGPLTNSPLGTGSFGGVASHSGPMMPNSAVRSSYPSGPLPVAAISTTGGSSRHSGPLNRHGQSFVKASGPQSGVTPMTQQYSGPLPPVLTATGLITSGPVSSGPLNSSGAQKGVSGLFDSTGSTKLYSSSFAHNQAVTKLHEEGSHSFKKRFSKAAMWSIILLFVMGFVAGGFILGAFHNAILLIVVVVTFALVVTLFTWNSCWRKTAMTRFLSRYPDAELRIAKNGQYIKISGVVTCGNLPLESSFQKVPRCVYTSSRLYEYRGWDSKAANPQHRHFSWGLRATERHVVDFYISDFQTGLRALVKTGHGARVTPYVDESIVVDINPSNKDMSPEFLTWLKDRNLSSDDRVMRLKEGYIKEGSTVSVMGVVQRNDNVLMIIPPAEPMSIGCQWSNCVLPASLEGIVLKCEDNSQTDAIPV